MSRPRVTLTDPILFSTNHNHFDYGWFGVCAANIVEMWDLVGGLDFGIFRCMDMTWARVWNILWWLISWSE